MSNLTFTTGLIPDDLKINKTPAQAFNLPAKTKDLGVERSSWPTPFAREYFYLARLDRVFRRDFAKRASPFVQINTRNVYLNRYFTATSRLAKQTSPLYFIKSHFKAQKDCIDC